MKQQEMFNVSGPSIWYRRKPGGRRGVATHFVELFDSDGEVIIAAEYTGKGYRGLRDSMIKEVKRAWMLRNYRPLGDEYVTGKFIVYYLYEV